MNITYDYYRIFYYVAKYHSFTQAANVLFSSQPNVTRAIKNLENELGCTLFVRSNKGVELTPEGERLFFRISVAFEHIQAAEEELTLDKGLQSGLVTISVTEIALHCHVLKILKEFHKKYPGVHIRLTNHSTPKALEYVKSGLADIAVVTSPISVSKPLKETVIKPVYAFAVCSSYFSELANRRISLKELSDYPIILLGKNTTSHSFYSDFFINNGITINPAIEAATTDQILPMVKNDLGIGFVPSEFIENDADQNNLIIIDTEVPFPQRNICLIKNTERPLSIVAKELEKMLVNKY